MATKYTKLAVKWTEWPQNIPTSFTTRPSKIYPNWDFWFENMPSGNVFAIACPPRFVKVPFNYLLLGNALVFELN
jgi:hypothetical protein